MSPDALPALELAFNTVTVVGSEMYHRASPSAAMPFCVIDAVTCCVFPHVMELTRFGGHLTVPDTEVFSEWIIEKAEATAESTSHIQ